MSVFKKGDRICIDPATGRAIPSPTSLDEKVVACAIGPESAGIVTGIIKGRLDEVGTTKFVGLLADYYVQRERG